MADIVTDIDVLHKVSEKADNNEINSIILQLKESIPDNALGLAAIQINIPRRIFITNLSSGVLAFSNPEITWKSAEKVPSVEGCLSIPGVTRCVGRHSQIKITYLSDDKECSERFSGQDAFIIQHECDHINGVLITDHTEIKTLEEKTLERNQNREKRIAKSRGLKNVKKEPPKHQNIKISVNKKAKLQREAQKRKKKERTARRQAKIRVEIEERYKVAQKNLFNDEAETP